MVDQNSIYHMANHVVYKGVVSLDESEVPLEIVTPSWAPGFKCLENCGACCITDPPKYPIQMPTVQYSELETSVCKYLNSDNRCARYEQRPIGCRIYPFNIIGVENGKVVVSPSLSCPGTNDKNPIDVSQIQSILAKEQIYGTLKKLQNIDTVFFAQSDFRKFYYNLQWRLNRGIAEIFETKTSLLNPPVLDMIRKFFQDKIGTIPKGLETKELAQLLDIYPKDRLYIATRFDSHEVYHLYINGLTCRIRNRHGVEKTFRLQSTPHYSDAAWAMLGEYALLQLVRPLFSAAIHQCAVLGQLDPARILEIFISSLVSCFIDIDIGSWIVSSRDNLDKIDVEGVREVIGWADAPMSARYRGPAP